MEITRVRTKCVARCGERDVEIPGENGSSLVFRVGAQGSVASRETVHTREKTPQAVQPAGQ